MDNNGSNNRNNRNNKNGMTLLIFVVAALVVLFVVSMINNGISRMTNQEITYDEFLTMVEEDKISEIVFSNGLINITPKTKEGQIPIIKYYTVQLNDLNLIPTLYEHKDSGLHFKGEQASQTTNFLINILSFIIPIAILWIILGFIMRRMGGGGGMMGVGKSTAKVYVEKQTGVTFKDVAGQDEAKGSLQAVVDFRLSPSNITI